jgi:hypothetical protein
MPPFAGLDELYHVGRVAFTARENRSPTLSEPSLPRYLAESAAGIPGVPPAFGLVGARWPDFVSRAPWPDPPLSNDDVSTFVAPNYEAQQPALFYAGAARVLRAFPDRTRLRELLILRLLAAGGALAARSSGRTGLVAATLVAISPTWLTLVARASNDALACGLLALAILLSCRTSRRAGAWLLEGAAWGAAIATKVYVWPLVVLVPFLWRRSVSWKRALVVGALIIASALLTMRDLSLRTGSAVGAQEFARSVPSTFVHRAVPLRQLAAVFVSSAIWPGAQHGNAMKPLAMLLYAGPVLALLSLGLRVSWSARTRRAVFLSAFAIALFMGAQAVHAYGFLRQAWASGEAMPGGGAEGWYLWSLAPVLVLSVGHAVRGLTRHPLALGFLVVWLVASDVVVHEGALFRDYAGMTSPRTPSRLFRWGPDPSRSGVPMSLVGAGRPSAWVLILLRASSAGSGACLNTRTRDGRG